MVAGIVAIISVFTTAIVFFYLFFTSRHKQRMALIEHGQSADLFSGDGNKFESLKQGMVAIAAGIGVLVGYFLQEVGMIPPVAYLVPILILGGLSLVTYYYFLQRKEAN